jgi:AcrR family transcriptional regulator
VTSSPQERTDQEGTAQGLSISQLEKASGVGRATIHFYIGEELLPPGQKARATRALYDQTHVDLLREIGRLKEEGLSLREIRDRLRGRIEAAAGNGLDLVTRQHEGVRNTILQVAARRFAERGYERTRIADICEDAGVTAQVLYAQFPSKHHLFVACYEVYYEWMYDQAQPAIDATGDLNARLAWRSWASYGIRAFSPDLQALARVETVHPESELRDLLRRLFATILDPSVEELAGERRAGANPGLFDDELVAYAFEGALGNMQMRASWDGRYSKRDVMRTFLAMWMAVRAAYAGRVDLTDEWVAVAELVDRLATSSPRVPDELDG